jgi:hypothetical protein
MHLLQLTTDLWLSTELEPKPNGPQKNSTDDQDDKLVTTMTILKYMKYDPWA